MQTLTKTLDLICLGRASVDLYGQQIGDRLQDVGSFAKSLGGSSCNIAFGAARLGLKASMLTRVGDEQFGQFIREELQKAGCDTSHVVTDPKRLTALAILSIKTKDQFPLLFYRTDCADMAVDKTDFDEAYIASAKALLITGTHFSTAHVDAVARHAISFARNNNTKVILDIDYRPVLWGLTRPGDGDNRFVSNHSVTAHLQSIVPLCDLIVGTEEEFHIAGGSTDTFNREGVFAILPGYSYDFAPHDSEIRARTQQIGTDLKVGDQVTITTSGGALPQGTYTLLDPRYGILPGAVLLSATSLDVNRALPVAFRKDDGSTLVSGFRTSTGTAQNGGNDVRQAFWLEPETAFRPKSEVLRTSINEYQNRRAQASGTFVPRAGDGGSVSLSSGQVFDWLARFNLAGTDDLHAGDFDLSMPDIVVRRSAPQAGETVTVTSVTEQGELVQRPAGVVGIDQLEQLGAASILLGGVRTVRDDGKIQIERQASVVSFESDASGIDTLSISGELMAVAQQKASVASGLTLASTGADDGVQRHYVLQDDGAMVLVGNRADTQVSVEGAGQGDAVTLALGQPDAPGRVTLKGNAVQIDSTGQIEMNTELVLDSQAVGLGAGHPRGHQEHRCGAEVHQLGDVEGLHQPGRQDQWLGHRAHRHPQEHLRQRRFPERDPAPDSAGRIRGSSRRQLLRALPRRPRERDDQLRVGAHANRRDAGQH